LKIISPEYAAPDGAKNIFDFRFYKYVAPTALDFQNHFLFAMARSLFLQFHRR